MVSQNGGPVGRVFVSYTEADEAWATWIAWQLASDGWQADVQAWDVAPGANFVSWMNDRLAGADHVLLLVASRASLASGWVGAEWQSAYTPDSRRVVPVRIEPVEPKGLLAKLVRIDLFDMDSDDARHRLLRRMRAAWFGVDPRPESSPAFPGGAAPGGAAPGGAARAAFSWLRQHRRAPGQGRERGGCALPRRDHPAHHDRHTDALP